MSSLVRRCAVLLAGIALSATTLAAERAIDKEVVVPAAQAEVWSAWTTREGITSFFAPDAKVELRVDGAFEPWFNPFAQPGLRGADGMRFLALQPPRMLSFTWNAPPHLAEARGQRTFVIVRLQPLGERETRVTLHHTGWGDGGDWDKTYAYFDKAWGSVLGNLKKRFESGPIDWTNWLEQVRKMEQK